MINEKDLSMVKDAYKKFYLKVVKEDPKNKKIILEKVFYDFFHDAIKQNKENLSNEEVAQLYDTFKKAFIKWNNEFEHEIEDNRENPNSREQ